MVTPPPTYRAFWAEPIIYLHCTEGRAIHLTGMKLGISSLALLITDSPFSLRRGETEQAAGPGDVGGAEMSEEAFQGQEKPAY